MLLNLPWRLVPAHIITHAAIFAAVTARYLDRTTGRFTGMSEFVYHLWLLFGFAGLPLISVAYIVARHSSGRKRYLALWLHTNANLAAIFVLVAYAVAAYRSGVISVHRYSMPAWGMLAASAVLLCWLIINDLSSLMRTERLATKLMIIDKMTDSS